MNSTSHGDPPARGGGSETADTPERASEPEAAGSQPVPERPEPRPAAWSNDELIPFGKYILLNKLSSGATAAVYRARLRAEPGFERIVTIKRILPQMAGDAEFVETFVEEAKLCARLTHANICPIYELGKVGESLYMALQWVAGKDLGAMIRRLAASGETMPPIAAAWIASRLCDALDYAHGLKDAGGKPLFVHQDLSPANIVISYEGEVKLLDFGIARATGRAQQTNVDALRQKLGYMSPELVHGEVPDARSDVFGIGVCLFEMVTGQRLFAGADDIATLKLVSAASIKAPSSVRDGIPPALEAIILRALAREPDARWSSAGEMASALAQYVSEADASFGTRNVAELMLRSFEHDMLAERMRLHELVSASHDPQLIEQRRRFFASPLGAAAVAKAEAARRAKTSAPPGPLRAAQPAGAQTPTSTSASAVTPSQNAPLASAAGASGSPAAHAPAGPAPVHQAAGLAAEDDDALTRYHAPLMPASSQSAAPPAAEDDDEDEPTSFLGDVGRVARALRAGPSQDARARASVPPPAAPASSAEPTTPTGPLPPLTSRAARSRPAATLGASSTLLGIAPQSGVENAALPEGQPDDSALAVIAKARDVAQFDEQATQIFFSREHGFGLPELPAEEELSPNLPAPLHVASPSASVRPKSRPPTPPPGRVGRNTVQSTPAMPAEARPPQVSTGAQRAKPRYNIAPKQATQRLRPLASSAPAASAQPDSAVVEGVRRSAVNGAAPPASSATQRRAAATGARGKVVWVVAAVLVAMIAVAFTHQPVGIALGLRKPPHGVLEVRTAPDVSAAIRIDGTYRGRTPIRLEDIPAGSRVLELEAEGYERVSRLVDIEGGAVVTENVQLNLQNAAASAR